MRPISQQRNVAFFQPHYLALSLSWSGLKYLDCEMPLFQINDNSILQFRNITLYILESECEKYVTQGTDMLFCSRRSQKRLTYEKGAKILKWVKL